MSSILYISYEAKELIVALVFIVAGLGVTAAEAVWLYRNGWAPQAKSIGYTVVTNLIGVLIVGLMGSVAFSIIMVVTFSKELSDALGSAGMWGLVAIGLLFGLLLLMLTKRLFLRVFQMRTGRSAWVFSIVSAVLVFVVAAVVPSVIKYFLTRASPFG